MTHLGLGGRYQVKNNVALKLHHQITLHLEIGSSVN